MFGKILIANRGEIATRIQRTARRMGVHTVAVYSEADRDAPHVAGADEAVFIGPSPAPQSYLDIEKIIAAAVQTGAEAIHPGYGFLSENAAFAAACAEAGLNFIGPPADVINTMGSKRDAKALMAEHGVPVVPGYFGDVDNDTLAREAEVIGYPLLIKASAGGGGRGMRLVAAGSDFADALQSARREALGSFGDDTVLLEKYIELPRHIEVQIFGDTHGNVVHLFERDCSVQRRYQKIIEEAPAPSLTSSQRELVLNAAVTAGKAAGYVGAGTVEFVVDTAGEVYFIEMNTRLQVEHPVTEMITNLDLVEWQLRVACGWQLPDQSTIAPHGHAIELRLCAEDPANDFAPSTGRIDYLEFPSDGVRVDHGIARGFSIPPYYDSMVAKVITHGPDREAARRQALTALGRCRVTGVTTNAAFLSAILAHEEFQSGQIDTHFIARHGDSLLDINSTPSGEERVLAVLGLLNQPATDGSWGAADTFRLNLPYRFTMTFIENGDELPVVVTRAGAQLSVDFGDTTVEATIERFAPNEVVCTIAGRRFDARVLVADERIDVFYGAHHRRLQWLDPLANAGHEDGGAGGLTAPMPGTVLEVFVTVGQEVTAGTPILLMEAMKIEHTITAPTDGIVSEIRFSAGDQITAEDVELAVMQPS